MSDLKYDISWFMSDPHKPAYVIFWLVSNDFRIVKLIIM